MTAIRTTTSLTSQRTAAATGDWPTSVSSSGSAAAAVDGAAVDRFVRTSPRSAQSVAGTPLGIASAFVLNGVAIFVGVSNQMVGLGPAPVHPRPTVQTTELVVRRVLGGV
ncbi:MAG: hypothetical protein FJ137_04595 [Deltaproteobacteria bacterium]|nr:hypothetical protein [Deltaproteobacteria bacterium]